LSTLRENRNRTDVRYGQREQRGAKVSFDSDVDRTLKEKSMNTNRIAVALAMLLLAVAPNLHAACSNASLHGTYGYSSQGFVSVTPDISPALFLPQAQTGVVTFDGRGSSSGTYTISSTDPAGEVNRGTFTGTYAVNSDCTGTAEVLIDTGGSVHLDFVILSPTEFVSINTDAGSSIIYSGKKIRQ
jgi:hypothetical protein